MSLELDNLIKSNKIATLNNSRYILFELPMNSELKYLNEVICKLLDLKLVEIDTNSYEVNLRKANFVEIVEKLREDNEMIIVGTELGQVE